MSLHDFRCLSVYTSVNVYTSDKSETSQFPPLVNLHMIVFWQFFPVLIMRLLIIGLVHFFELCVPALRLFVLIQNIYLSPSLRWCFSIYFSRIQCRRLLNWNALLGRRLRTWISWRKREEMGHFLGSPKPSKFEDAGADLRSAVPWSWYSQNVRQRKLWRHLPRRPVWETVDLKPDCLAKKAVNLWPQIRSQNLTPVLGSTISL